MTRTFVAIELDDAVRAELARSIARLGHALPWVRWVAPDSLHLTLAFLGELDDAQLAAVYTATAEAALSVGPFALRLGALGTFGPPRAPRVIWRGVAGDLAALARLHESLAAALEARGFARDTRAFAAHLTLARLSTPPTAEQAARLSELVRAEPPAEPQSHGTPATHIDVRAVSVMRSELLQPAARYTRLRVLPLGMT